MAGTETSKQGSGPTFWYLCIENTPLEGTLNMAVDQHLLRLVESGEIDRPVLRIYFWAKATLSLGYHQRWQRTVNEAALRRHDVALVRRWTGGRAVLHDPDEITYALIAPMSAPFSSRISENYCLIGKALERFSDLGSASVARTAPGDDPAEAKKKKHLPCFASLAPAEIETKGRKLIGSAQKLGKGAFLQHGSIPMAHRDEVLEAVTGTTVPMAAFMSGMAEHFGRAGRPLPSRPELVALLVAAFETQFGVSFQDLRERGFPDREASRAIAAETFGRDEWTFRK